MVDLSGERAGPDRSAVAGWLGPALSAAGWAWPVPAGDAVDAAINAVLATIRDPAPALLGDQYSDLPRTVAADLVTLVAGSRTRDLAERVFINQGCTFLDYAGIRFGEGVTIGPKATFITSGHPVDSDERGFTSPAHPARTPIRRPARRSKRHLPVRLRHRHRGLDPTHQCRTASAP